MQQPTAAIATAKIAQRRQNFIAASAQNIAEKSTPRGKLGGQARSESVDLPWVGHMLGPVLHRTLHRDFIVLKNTQYAVACSTLSS